MLRSLWGICENSPLYTRPGAWGGRKNFSQKNGLMKADALRRSYIFVRDMEEILADLRHIQGKYYHCLIVFEKQLVPLLTCYLHRIIGKQLSQVNFSLRKFR